MAGLFLGVDGGGTKTKVGLIDLEGRVRAQREGGSSYYLQIGLEGLRRVLREGIEGALADAGAAPADVIHAFFGLPAYGEDSEVQPQLDAMPEGLLGHDRYRCGNDMLCGWAGSLAGQDGINIVAGTGSIAYGEREGRAARAGGWGELFSDEGSAYWIAVQGLGAFARMSDGRLPSTALHRLFRTHFGLAVDLDLCGRVMGENAPPRDQIAALSTLVAVAAAEGDPAAQGIFDRAADELMQIVEAVRGQLDYPPGEAARLSYSGGVFRAGEAIMAPFRRRIEAAAQPYRLTEPVLNPSLGAAVYAARLGGATITPQTLANLAAADSGA